MSPESTTQVMNPLVEPPLAHQPSVHRIESEEPKLKKIRLSGSFNADGRSGMKNSATSLSKEGIATSSGPVSNGSKDAPLCADGSDEANASTQGPGGAAVSPTGVSRPDDDSSRPSIQSEPPGDDSGPNPPSSRLPPTKLNHFVDLEKKYHTELTYMLREFEKLERQLLGARKTEESAGSRERREKLHSFIIHLQDTIQQIEAGAQEESSAEPATAQQTGEDGSKQDDIVPKLEEHILTNLLPVKVRLKKQLDAQQGARHNPAGMPHSGWNTRPDRGEKGTFVVAAEKKRIEAEQAYIEPRAPAKPVEPDQTQFGKPIEEGGSSLTKKLHGETLGKKDNTKKEPPATPTEKKRYYGGMALGSDQIQSSVTAASSVHKLMVRDPELIMKAKLADQKKEKEDILVPQKKEKETPNEEAKAQGILRKFEVEPYPDVEDMERRRRRRRRRRKRQQKQEKCRLLNFSEAPKIREKKSRQMKKQRGPRQVEYICALCNEVYSSTCECNPWWALTHHECPKCHKKQIPRVDIGAAANAIEYHPALLAHADENGAVAQTAPMTTEIDAPIYAPPLDTLVEDTISLGSDVSSGLEDVSSDDEESLEPDSDCDSFAMTPGDRAENENFGAQYTGPKLEDDDASRLLLLMAHASTCSGHHRLEKQREVCRSIRWMMMHVRDCPGTTLTFDVCPFPWCRKVKHLMYHLVSCMEGDKCKICANPNVSNNLHRLRGLNEHRLQKYRELLIQKQQAQEASVRNPARGSHPGEFLCSCDAENQTECAKSNESQTQPVPKESSRVDTNTTAQDSARVTDASVSTSSKDTSMVNETKEHKGEKAATLLNSSSSMDAMPALDDPLLEACTLELANHTVSENEEHLEALTGS